MTALDYWNHRFAEEANHHRQQNGAIAADFFKLVTGDSGIGYLRLRSALSQSKRIIELGCGTGELTARLEWMFRPHYLVATDLSPAAITAALARYPFLRFAVYDLFSDDPPEPERFDLAIISNVLEHFTDPHAIIDRVLRFADQVLVIVPYRQAVTDDFRHEGEAGHVVELNKGSFKRYDVAESVVFKTDGWQYGPNPKELAVLLGAK